MQSQLTADVSDVRAKATRAAEALEEERRRRAAEHSDHEQTQAALKVCACVCVCVCVCVRARVSHRTSPMPPSPRLESHSGQEQTSAAEELEERVESLEGTLESCYSEIHRGNAIIARLQGELAAARGDVRVRSDVAVQQEERIEQLQAECSQLRQDLKR